MGTVDQAADQTLDGVLQAYDDEPTKNSGELDSYERVRRVQDNSFRIRTLVSTWEHHQKAERLLRARYANWFFLLLLAEVLLVNLGFFLIGLKVLSVSDWVANTFIIGVFAKIAGMTLLIMRYLFPRPSSQLLDLIERL